MPMQSFVYNPQVSRVVFGEGRLAGLADELDLLKAQRALVVTSPGQAAAGEALVRQLGVRSAGLHARAQMHVPVEIIRPAVEAAEALGADAVIAYGGGSTIGLAKAMALEIDLPVLAVPTTYSGSEMTPIYGITEGGHKRTGRDARVLPRVVVYDPALTGKLPVATSIASGMNAIAHAVEALYSRDRNPITDLMAEQGIEALARALPRLREAPSDAVGRSEALYGAWLCGSVLGSVGMALHHKLCHTLGGRFNLPHAETHTIVLPHVVAFNSASAPEAMQRIARALHHDDAAAGLRALALRCGAPLSLREIGMNEQDLDEVASLVVAAPYWNPRPVTASERDAVRSLLQNAFEGRPPMA